MAKTSKDVTKNILSTEYGGNAKIKDYCRNYQYKPPFIKRKILCAGISEQEQCPDYQKCLENNVPETALIDIIAIKNGKRVY